MAAALPAPCRTVLSPTVPCPPVQCGAAPNRLARMPGASVAARARFRIRPDRPARMRCANAVSDSKAGGFSPACCWGCLLERQRLKLAECAEHDDRLAVLIFRRRFHLVACQFKRDFGIGRKTQR